MALNIYKKGIYRKAPFVLFFGIWMLLLPKVSAEVEKEPFNAGGAIIEHIIDAYEWHILTIGETHVSIPLPVILINEGKLYVFSSSHFHHGHDSYKNFAISHEEGMKKGRIVKVNDDGSVNEESSIIDLSITKNVLSLFIGVILLAWLLISVARGYAKRGFGAPKGAARVIEPFILFVKDDIAKPSIGPKHEKYLPFLLTMFFFIFFNNLFGLIPIFPGGANLTGNTAVALVLALFTFVVTNVSGNRDYWKHIINTPGVPWYLKIPLPIMPVVEIVGVITKPIVLMIRLFANITAGHIICLGFICLIFIFGEMKPIAGYGVSVVSVFFYIFISLLELLVAFIQAYVFTLLSSIYIGMAIEEHHHEVHETHELTENKE